jgi:hypothetical protein
VEGIMSLHNEIEQAIRIHWSRKDNTTAYRVSGEIINKVLDAAVENVRSEYDFKNSDSPYDIGIRDAIEAIQALKLEE